MHEIAPPPVVLSATKFSKFALRILIVPIDVVNDMDCEIVPVKDTSIDLVLSFAENKVTKKLFRFIKFKKSQALYKEQNRISSLISS